MLYLQDVDILKQQRMEQKIELTIQKEDLLSIIVNSRTPELTRPFNLIGGNENSTIGYTVDSNGDIDYPIIGKLHVAGLSRVELQDLIKKKLIEENLLNDPTVIAQFLNFKICILGEVRSPGEFTITGDRITLFEALSKAGDITENGRRDRVIIIREEGGTRTFLANDIRTSEIFMSPYYYLQQNDIIYVEPTKQKTQKDSKANWAMITSVTGFIMGITAFVFAFTK